MKPEKAANIKKWKVEALLVTEINLTSNSDEDEKYSVTSPNFIRSSISKPEKKSHPTTKLVISRNANPEEHLFRALVDTGARSVIILETHTSNNSSKMMTASKPPGVLWVVSLLLIRLGTPGIQPQEKRSWTFHVDNRSEWLRSSIC